MKREYILKSLPLLFAIISIIAIAAIFWRVNNLARDVIELQVAGNELQWFGSAERKELLERVDGLRNSIDWLLTERAQQVSKPVEVKEPEPLEITRELPLDPKTGWQIYRSKFFGFEIRFPKEFVFDSFSFSESLGKRIVFTNSKKIVSISISMPIREVGYEGHTTVKKEETKLDGVTVHKSYMVPITGEIGLNVKNNFTLMYWNFEDYQNSGEILFSYPTGEAQKYEKLFDQIFSTFKLIN